MAKHKSDVNKSDEIRQVLRANPKMPVREVISTLAGKGIEVRHNLVYFVKGHMRGRKGRRKKAPQMLATVAPTSNGDALTTIRKLKTWAEEVGGLKKLKALVDALSGLEDLPN